MTDRSRTIDPALLPAADAAPRCAVHAAEIGVDPGGTAIAAAAVAIVEVPLPWPKPVFAHADLAGLSSMMDLACGPTRVLAAEPRLPATEAHRVTVFERNEVGVISTVLEVPRAPGALADLFAQLTQAHPRLLDHHHAPVDAPELAMAVCTQGTHDVCCGSEGMRFANAIGEAAPGLAVYKVSHTGGHRFAPTAMTLPDGRMWANLDVASALSILDLTGDPSVLADRCRGWWGVSTGPAQIAELAVFRELGWDLDVTPREVSVHATDDGWIVEVDAARATWTVEVIAGRVVPTIACRAEGGLPAKAAQEYEVVSITRPAGA